MEGPDPGGDDNTPTVTIVHRIKCRLGYAELHKPAPGFGPGEEVGRVLLNLEKRKEMFCHTWRKGRNFFAKPGEEL